MERLIFTEKRIVFINKTNSTNDYATKIAKLNSTDEGTIIWALYQTDGKGQKGNKWESDVAQNLTFSIILKPTCIEPANQFILTQAISLSMIDFIKNILPSKNIMIKWPNDIYIEKNKVAGILIENQIMGNQIENSIIGIGLNVNQILFSEDIPNPVSLKLISNKEYKLEELLHQFLPFIERRIQQLYNSDLKLIKKDYLNNLLYFNVLKKYLVKEEIINASIIGISEYGKLLLQTDSGTTIECDLKEIKFLHQ